MSTNANTSNDPLDAQGRTHDASEHATRESNDDVVTFTELVARNEVTVVMQNGEVKRTVTIRCGDIELRGEGSNSSLDNSITSPGTLLTFDFEHAEIIREVIEDRLTGQSTTTEGETHAGRERREQQERLRNRQSGRYSGYFGFDGSHSDDPPIIYFR